MNQRGDIPDKPDHKKFWRNPLVLLLGGFVVFIGSQQIAVLILLAAGFKSTSDPLALAIITGSTLAILVSALAVALKIAGFSWKSLGFRKLSLKSLTYVFPVGLVYLAGSLLFSVLAMKLLPGFDIEQAQDIGIKTTESWPSLVLTFAALVVFTPLVEEIVFRGILFNGISKKVSPVLAAVLSSLLFAFLHGQWNVAIDVFAMGLAACYLLKKTNSIYPSIALHMLKNGIAFTLLFLVPFLNQ